MRLPLIAARLLDTPLMVHGGKAATIMTAVGDRIVGQRLHVVGAETLGTIGDGLGREYDAMKVKTYDVINGVAIIPVEGTLVHKGGWIGMASGETSYQGLQTQVVRAMRDDAVRGVVFEVDSYGGEVSGAFETSDMIFELSRVKPTLAILTDVACSAGYLMASACRQIVIPERGIAGSIGVIAIHVDQSAAIEAEGLKVTIIQAGRHKADGNPFEPLPKDVYDGWLSEIEASRVAFAKRVSSYRAGRLSTEQALATEAATYRGADAVAAGLCDGVGHPSEAAALFVSDINRA